MPRSWVKDRRRDTYYREAKRRKYRSRAAFKLLQIQKRFRPIRRGDGVVDLGASPGGWAQVASELAGPTGRIVAADRVRMRPVEGVSFVLGDVSDEDVRRRIVTALGTAPNVVLSDMAPKLSGSGPYDQARALDLADIAHDFALLVLRPGGNLVVKAFQGEGYRAFLEDVRGNFGRTHGYRPPATTKTSRETYVVGLGRR